jgi:signal transduction histidine kinase
LQFKQRLFNVIGSLRGRLILLWIMVVAASLTAGLLMVGLYRQTTTAQIGRAEAVIARSCDAIARSYHFYMTSWPGPAPALDNPSLRQGLTTVVQVALRDQSGIEGGIWQLESGPLAYAFPTYGGSGTKTDIPDAELTNIRRVNASAANDEGGRSLRIEGRSETVLLQACPLNGIIPELTAWTMTRVSTSTGEGISQLRLGLGVLAACVVAAAALLTWLLMGWSGRVARIEAALASHEEADLPALATTGEHDLDRIVLALNQAGARVRDARRQSEAMSRKAANAERLAAIGRMTAAFAHEIRNPIAAMRLKAENALAGDDLRRQAALPIILTQIGRLDRLVGQLLTASDRKTPQISLVAMVEFLEQVAAVHRDAATARGVTLTVKTSIASVYFDRDLLGRALDNLIGNALQHVSDGGEITVLARPVDAGVQFTVSDTGPGVPAALRDTLFEPFVTGRANGTGLGLSIVREVVESHGGKVRLEPSERGACFVIEIPASGVTACQPS